MESRSQLGFENDFAEIWKREIGLSPPRNVARRLSASEAVISRIDLCGKLDGHKGCVNCVEFNSTGDLLVSGSDDRRVIFWDWPSRSKTFSFHSGHLGNIFQARILPFTDDRRVVTSSSDGQVRLCEISECWQVHTKRLGKHQGGVHALAVELGSPHVFYSCGEDGLVQHFDLRSSSASKLFYCFSFDAKSRDPANSIGLNAIVIDPRNPLYFAIGGSDEYARVYDIRRCQLDSSSNTDAPVNTYCAPHLIKSNNVHITGLAYSKSSELLVSYSDELIYLFQKNMGLGPCPSSIQPEDLQKIEKPEVYAGHRNSKTVKGVSFFGPKDEYVMSGSDCGHIFIWKKKDGKLVRVMVGDRHIVNHLEPHPHMPFLATCGIEKNVKLWAPMATDSPPLPDNLEEIMESNRRGREDNTQAVLTPDVIMHVLRLQRRQPSIYTERRHGTDDVQSDEEDEDYIIGILREYASSEEGSEEHPEECTIC